MDKSMTLLQGDCLELMKDIPDKSIDMILCDLPYGKTKIRKMYAFHLINCGINTRESLKTMDV